MKKKLTRNHLPRRKPIGRVCLDSRAIEEHENTRLSKYISVFLLLGIWLLINVLVKAQKRKKYILSSFFSLLLYYYDTLYT
jgi:hypothetical protein